MPKDTSRTKTLTELKQLAERLQRQAEDLAAVMNRFEKTAAKKPRPVQTGRKRGH